VPKSGPRPVAASGRKPRNRLEHGQIRMSAYRHAWTVAGVQRALHKPDGMAPVRDRDALRMPSLDGGSSALEDVVEEGRVVYRALQKFDQLLGGFDGVLLVGEQTVQLHDALKLVLPK